MALESRVVGRFKLIKIRRILWISDSALGRVHYFFVYLWRFLNFGRDFFFFGRVNIAYILQIEYEWNVLLI